MAARLPVQWQQGCRFNGSKAAGSRAARLPVQCGYATVQGFKAARAAKAKGTAMAVRVPSASFSLSAVDYVPTRTFYVPTWTDPL